MSAFICEKEQIETITQATAYVLQLNRKYKASYPLAAETVNLFGKYADDLHSIYRALYIANIKAVNGRYKENTKTLPKYTGIKPWNIEYNLDFEAVKKAACVFSCYCYQIAEEPVIYSPVWFALNDIRKCLCMIYMDRFGFE